MIINAQQSDIQVTGDITEFKSSIDPKNLEFITTLLSSNLYSAPERSFIREIVSNAWDSQVEAGTTDIPIIVKITESEETHYYGKDFTGCGDITIRDFGTGLSPERFNDIYRNIGSSTKRESNDYHGAFGIGHLSGFSCSNTMYITSYYNGTCYEYIGIKDANTIVYTLITTDTTTEKNGLEVTLKNVCLEKYRNALKYICFFPNVYVEDNHPYCYSYVDINNIKIKKYTNFWVSSYVTKDKILLGNVLYPLDDLELNLLYNNSNDNNKILKDFLGDIYSTGIVLKFDIGELNVTPNRESIIYTKDCITKIINKVKAAYEEITDIILDKAKEDFTDIVEYTNLVTSDKCYDFFEDKLTPHNYGLYNISRRQALNLTYKGNALSIYKDLLWYLVYNLSYCSKWLLYNDVIHTVSTTMPYKYKSKLSLKCVAANSVKIIILKEDIKLSKYIREWIINKDNDDTIILHPLEFNTIKRAIMYDTRLDTYSDTSKIDFIIQEVIDYLYNKGTVIDFNNDKDFIKYKELRKEENKLNRKNNINDYKNVIINIYHTAYSCAVKRTYRTLDDAVKYLKSLHKGIVTIERDTTSNIKDVIIQRGFVPISVNKKIKEALKEYSFNVELDWVLNKDPNLTFYRTIVETLENEKCCINRLQALAAVVSSNYLEDISNIIKARQKYCDSSNNYIKCAKAHGNIDDSLKNRVLKIKEFLDKYNEALDILEDSGVPISPYIETNDIKFRSLITKIIVKNKSFMVNAKAYRSTKRNKLINILCKK